MESIDVEVDRRDGYYTLTLDSQMKLSIKTIDLYACRIEDCDPDRGIIYVDLKENQFYKTKEVGAYRNSIELNLSEDRTVTEASVEIRLSFVCVDQNNVKNIFIRAKKWL